MQLLWPMVLDVDTNTLATLDHRNLGCNFVPVFCSLEHMKFLFYTAWSKVYPFNSLWQSTKKNKKKQVRFPSHVEAQSRAKERCQVLSLPPQVISIHLFRPWIQPPLLPCFQLKGRGCCNWGQHWCMEFIRPQIEGDTQTGSKSSQWFMALTKYGNATGDLQQNTKQ